MRQFCETYNGDEKVAPLVRQLPSYLSESTAFLRNSQTYEQEIRDISSFRLGPNIRQR
jgi:hypothetical protein